MSTLLVNGDYGKVMASRLEDGDVARLALESGRWGLGLGAAPGGEGISRFGEALVCGRSAAVLPASSPGEPRTASEALDTPYLAAFSFEEALCYYTPPGKDWSFSAVLRQMFNELSLCSDSPGMYGFCAAGTFWRLDVQALAAPPFLPNAPQDGGPINSPSNYPRFLRRRGGRGRFPFAAAGVFLKPSLLDLRSGAGLLERAFGPSLDPGRFHFHAHAALFDDDVPLLPADFHSPADLEDFAAAHLGDISSVEHVLPDCMVFDARFFLTPLYALAPFEG